MTERMFALFLFSCILFTAQCCMNDGDCNTGQCCNNYHGPMIVSKRESSLLHQLQPLTGKCEDYKVMHDPCSPFEKLNGHCSCGPGLSCQFVPEPTTTLSKRKLYLPGNGSYKCV